MTGLFLELVNMSLSAGILVLAVVGLRFLLKKAPKWLTCCLWILVAVRLVCPISMESVFSLIPQPVSSGDALEVLTNVYTENIQVIGDNSPNYQAAVDAGRVPEYNGQFEGRAYYVVTTAMDGVSEPATLADAFSIIWLAGMCLMAGYALISYLRLRHKVSASMCLRENIYLCDYIESPFILGIVKPRIYLPSSMEQSQWHHVLAHERAHLRRKDHWWKPLGYILLSLHWFNPLIWLAYVLLCRDIELACDEKVIKELDVPQKKAYSEALLACSVPRYMIAACPLAFGEVGVKERVKTVLNYRKPAFWIILVAIAACIAAAVCFLTDPVEEALPLSGSYASVSAVYTVDSEDSPAVYPTYMVDRSMNLFGFAADGSMTAIGELEAVEMSRSELLSYMVRDDDWAVSKSTVKALTAAYWLYREDGSFYVLFQTRGGKFYLGCGWEDYGERNEALSDDTHITALYSVTHQEPDEQMGEEISSFRATVQEVSGLSLLVQAEEGYWETGLLWATAAGSTEFAVGDSVVILHDGLIMETYPGQLYKTYGVAPAEDPSYIAISGNHQVSAILRPAGTDISVIAGKVSFLTLTENDLRVIQCLPDEYTSSGTVQSNFPAMDDSEYATYEIPGVYGQYRVYEYPSLEEVEGFNELGSQELNWDLLEPGNDYIVTLQHDGLVCFGLSYPHDLGITLTGRNITPTGMTVDCTQSGGTTDPNLDITYGEVYLLQVLTENGWKKVPYVSEDGGAFLTVAYVLERDSTVTWNINWESRYGALEPGTYRFIRNFSCAGKDGASSDVNESVVFTIQNESSKLADLGLTVSSLLLDGDSMELTLQLTGNATVTYGSEWFLEEYFDGQWHALPYSDSKDGTEFVWTDELRYLTQDEPTVITIYWEYLYGELSPGLYRIGKEFIDESTGEVIPIYAEFAITD